MASFAGVALPVRTNRYRDNDVKPIISYGLQESSRQVSYRPSPIARPNPQPYFTRQPFLSSSGQSAASARNVHTSSPPSQAAVEVESGATNVQEGPETIHMCSISGCRRVFSQPQVRSRHIKDMHEKKKYCPQCSELAPFTYSRGRPYLLRKHIEKCHTKNPPQQGASKSAKESLRPHTGPAKTVRPYPPSFSF